MSLSIIIVSYNTKTLLRDCLVSLYNVIQTDGFSSDTQVIVVDNASSDGSMQMVEREFPDVTIIKNKTNRGFAAANNQGIELATGDYLLLLNSDTKVKTGALQSMIVLLEKDKQIGVVGAKLLNPDGTLQPSAGYFPHLVQVMNWMWFLDDVPVFSAHTHSYHIHSADWYIRMQDADWVSGACMMVRRSCLDKAGSLDQNIFMYGEEVEWCFRIKQKGFRIVYTPTAQIYHHKGASSSGAHAGIVDEFRSLLYIYKKHKPAWQLFILRVFLFSGAWLRMGIFGIIGRYRERGTQYAKALEMVGR